MEERRLHPRIDAQSILVSLTNPENPELLVSGFLRNISLGGIKIQKISSKIVIEPGNYNCSLMLPEVGRINTRVQVLGSGDSNEKFGSHLIRMQFMNLDDDTKNKILSFISKYQVTE
ncbi:MAG TPA: PilZ domain-containing protein [Bacillota bacterium]|nr:PilZ domain-containing protein [Bacillota bacterium]